MGAGTGETANLLVGGEGETANLLVGGEGETANLVGFKVVSSSTKGTFLLISSCLT